MKYYGIECYNTIGMLSVIVIIFEAVVGLFIAIFGRTTDTTTSLITTYFSLISDSLALMLAFVLMYTSFRRLSFFSLLLLLVVLAVTAQTSLLFDTFWTYVFTDFSSSFAITFTLIVRCLFASLAVLITALDFMGLFAQWQVYFIMGPVMAIGYSLIEGIIVYGLDTFDGGGGMTVFLYSGACSLMIWLICLRGNIHPSRYKIKQSYINQTFSFIGVVIAFATWPKFNMAGSIATTYVNVNLTTISIASLNNSALVNTFMGLSTAVLTSILFASKDTKQDKLKFKCYIDCFINGGIVMATYQDVALNPSACMVLSCLTSIVTLVVHKYWITSSETNQESMFKVMMRNYSKVVFRILFAFIGSIIASIVVASRNGVNPQLLTADYSKKAGFQIVAFIVALALGLGFGALTALLIKIFMNMNKKSDEQQSSIEAQLSDFNYFQNLSDEAHPLYYQIFDQLNNKESDKININDYTTMIIKQSLLGAQDNPLRMITNSRQNQTRVEPIRPQNPDELSSQRQDQAKIQVNQSLTAQKSKVRISEDERLPKQQNKNVARKLNFDNSTQVKQEEGRSNIQT